MLEAKLELRKPTTRMGTMQQYGGCTFGSKLSAVGLELKSRHDGESEHKQAAKPVNYQSYIAYPREGCIQCITYLETADDGVNKVETFDETSVKWAYTRYGAGSSSATD